MERFLLAANQYTHLDFHNTFITMKTMLWGLYAGMLGAILLTLYRKVYLGKLVRKLLRAEALSEESAITLAEAGVKNNIFFRRALRNGGALRKYISICGDGITEHEVSKGKKRIRSFFGMDESPKSYDFTKLKLYIPEELKYKADVVYEEKGANPITFIVYAVLLTALVIGLSYVIPELMTMLDNFLVMILGSKPVFR